MENILLTHPSIADAAVMGHPDFYAGEVPRAYVVLKPKAKATEKEIKDYVAGMHYNNYNYILLLKKF